VNGIKEKPGLTPRISQHGFWLPPRALHGSEMKEGNTAGKYFYFNGSQVVACGDVLPQEAVLYKEISMYHSAGHFFIVPYNATKHQVGNGLQVEVVDSDDEIDEEADCDEDAPNEPTTVDWSVLSFHWRGEGKSKRTFLLCSPSATLPFDTYHSYVMMAHLFVVLAQSPTIFLALGQSSNFHF